MESQKEISPFVRKDKVRFYVDCSGSTGGQIRYWSRVMQIFTSLEQQYGVNNVIVLLWDDRVKYPSRSDFLKWIDACSGGGGTYPNVFASAQHMPEDCDAVIITDGQVSMNDVQICYRIVGNRRFNSVAVYLVSTGGEINLTVSAPFTANCNNISVYVQYDTEAKPIVDNVSTSIDVDLDKYLNDPERFLQEALRIRGIILLQNLGKELNMPLRDRLLALQKNLMNCIAKRGAGDSANRWDVLANTLTSGDYLKAVQDCRDMISTVDNSIGKQVESAIADLIAQCSGSNNFSLENLDPGRLRRADVVAAVPVAELPAQTVVTTFECPIMLEESNMAILIHTGDPVLKNINPKFIEAIMTNPLLVLDDENIMRNLTTRLGHLVGCDALTHLFSKPNPISPFTRDPLVSAFIPLVPTDSNARSQYAKANMFTLANLFFGDKLVGDTGLWMGVLYLALSKIPRFTENQEFMQTMHTFLRAFWRSHVTNITLSGLPIAPMIKAPTNIAIWFCVASPDIMMKHRQNDQAVIEDDASNRLRSFGASAKHLLALLDILGYAYDREWTVKQLQIYKVFAWMMNQSKDPDSNWRTIIRAQWQNHHQFPNGQVVLLDGPAVQPLPLPDVLQGLDLTTILSIMQYVDRTKTTNSIMLPRDLPFVPVPAAVTNYGYPELPDEWVRSAVPICPHTMRPFVRDVRDRKRWNERAIEMYGPLDKQIHNYNYFIQFVFDCGLYPQNQQQFIMWVLERQKNREFNPVDTLPKYQLAFVDGLFRDYEAVLGKNFEKVPVEGFKKRAWAGMREADRAKLDGSEI